LIREEILNQARDSFAKITFSELQMLESDIEELLRSNIDMVCDEEESMLIVGRQVRNAQHGRSDLTAVDNYGNIVLIEIKRDRKDIESRKEAFEFQAIRYAASYAKIVDPEDLVSKIYAPYIEKYRSEFDHQSLTSSELGNRKLNEFLQVNGAENNFNKNQKVVLVASEFDEQT
jgi:CRISPR/Cas system-associated exonuclease Cas4 (RecB family)